MAKKNIFMGKKNLEWSLIINDSLVITDETYIREAFTVSFAHLNKLMNSKYYNFFALILLVAIPPIPLNNNKIGKFVYDANPLEST